jgi:iron(III) transport system permease protein
MRWLGSPEAGLSPRLFAHYATGSLSVLAGSVLIALVWGLLSAYLCARYEFLHRKKAQIFAMLPLATPGYLVAYAWVDGLVDLGVPGGMLRTMPAAWLVLGLTLVPYVFLPVLAALASIPKSLIEVGQLAGMGRSRIFLKIELPIIYPALAGGSLLVGMEVLADFGTVDYLAIDTWSTAVYRSWYGYDDFSRAALLAFVLLCVSGSLVVVDFLVRRSKRVAAGCRNNAAIARTPLSGRSSFFALMIIGAPAFLMCVVPLVSLSSRIIHTTSPMFLNVPSLALASLHSILLACGGALLVVVCGTMLAGFTRNQRSALKGALLRLASLGYALPGGVLAIGLLLVLTPIGIGGSISALLIAYAIRFL